MGRARECDPRGRVFVAEQHPHTRKYAHKRGRAFKANVMRDAPYLLANVLYVRTV